MEENKFKLVVSGLIAVAGFILGRELRSKELERLKIEYEHNKAVNEVLSTFLEDVDIFNF